MKKLLLILSLLPSLALAAFAVPFNATSTTQGWISPTKINGTEQTVVATNFLATSTTATSTFQGGINAAVGGGCLAQNGTCVTVNGTTGTGLTGMLAGWLSSSVITASSTPQVDSIVASSTTSTSTFLGGVSAQETYITGRTKADVSSATAPNADLTFSVTGTVGGNTTITTTGTGGNGGGFTGTGGAGGVASGALTQSNGGVGGAFNFTGGTGGAATVSGTVVNAAGAGGGVTLLGGVGGIASGSTGGLGDEGGAGGAFLLRGGAGADSGDTQTGGSGGSLTLTGGAGGRGTTLQGGTGGALTMTAGAGGALTGTATGARGNGGAITFNSGSEGTGTLGTTGASGNFAFNVGVTRNGVSGGNAGTMTFTGRNGGTGTTGAGGNGTVISFIAGNGGNSSSATGGTPGDIKFTAGNGATGGTNTNGGSLYFIPGSATSPATGGSTFLNCNSTGTCRGTVGIGTTSPATNFSVQGAGYIGNNLFLGGTLISTTTATSTISGGLDMLYLNITGSSATSTSASGINVNTGCFSIRFVCVGGSSGGGGAWTSAGGNTTLNTITDLVGIGTSTPGAKLSVEQGGITTLGMYLSGYASATADMFRISTSTATATSSALTIDSNGKMGIGSTTPNAQLSVMGKAEISNGLKIDNGQILMAPAPSSAAPSYAFQDGTNYGMWYDAGQPAMRFVWNGVSKMQLNSTTFKMVGIQLQVGGGDAGTPAYAPQAWNTDSGMFFTTNEMVGLSTGGIERMRIDSLGQIGLSSSTPSATLSVTGSKTQNPFYISTTTATVASSTLFMIDKSGDIHFGGGTPTLSSCGTSPMLDANATDQSGTITPGATAAGCTLTFSTPKLSAPHCIVSAQTEQLVNALSYTETATALSLTQTSLTEKVDYFCPLGH